MLQKQRLTNRKFYNKWMYKASLKVPGVSIYRMKSHEELIAMLSTSDPYRGITTDTVTKAYKNKKSLIKLSQFLMNLQGEYAKRIERDTIDFYTNDEALFSTIVETFSSLIKHSYVPRNDLVTELDSNKYIICKKLPHNRYKFKVYLLPHKLKFSKEEKTKYIDWLTKQDAVNISFKTQKWFLNTDWYWDRRYMYVEDEKTLLMVQMRNPNVLGRVYEYLVSDKY